MKKLLTLGFALLLLVCFVPQVAVEDMVSVSAAEMEVILPQVEVDTNCLCELQIDLPREEIEKVAPPTELLATVPPRPLRI